MKKMNYIDVLKVAELIGYKNIEAGSLSALDLHK